MSAPILGAPAHPPRLMHSGLLYKQGKVIRNWRLRWFELYDDQVLLYYRQMGQPGVQRPRSAAAGIIDLRTCLALPMREELTLEIAWPEADFPCARVLPCCFFVVTSNRTYPLVAQLPSEVIAWRRALRQQSPQLAITSAQTQQQNLAECGFTGAAGTAEKPSKPVDCYDLLTSQLLQQSGPGSDGDDLVLDAAEDPEEVAVRERAEAEARALARQEAELIARKERGTVS